MTTSRMSNKAIALELKKFVNKAEGTNATNIDSMFAKAQALAQKYEKSNVAPNLASARKRPSEEQNGNSDTKKHVGETAVHNTAYVEVPHIGQGEEDLWIEVGRNGKAIPKSRQNSEGGTNSQRTPYERPWSPNPGPSGIRRTKEGDNQAENNANPRTKTQKPPPIHVADCTIRELARLLAEKNICKDAFRLKETSMNNNTIFADSTDDFAKIKEAIRETKKPFYTFTPKNEKHVSLILKGIRGDFEADEIRDEIQNSCDTDTKITKCNKIIFNKKNPERFHFLVQLAPGSKVSGVTKIEKLAYQKVRWEKLKKKTIMQCRKCQRLGHTSTNCGMEYRCVKCTEHHEPGMCKVNHSTPKEEITCVNCKSKGHPASYRGCPYLVFSEEIMKGKKKQAKEKREAKIANIRARSENVSYAQATKPDNRGAQQNTDTRTQETVYRSSALTDEKSQQQTPSTFDTIAESKKFLEQTLENFSNNIMQAVTQQITGLAKLVQENANRIDYLFTLLDHHDG